jgi:Holliday junction resolvase RusA-like endonuclease
MADCIELWLPYPPTVNHTYIRRGRKVFKSPEAQAFFDAVHLLARGLEPLVGELVLSVDFYRPRRSGDVDNRIKALQDSLQGFAYANDSQIVELHIRRFDDKKNHPNGAARVTVAPQTGKPAKSPPRRSQHGSSGVSAAGLRLRLARERVRVRVG